MFRNRWIWWLHNTVNVRNATQLLTKMANFRSIKKKKKLDQNPTIAPVSFRLPQWSWEPTVHPRHVSDFMPYTFAAWAPASGPLHWPLPLPEDPSPDSHTSLPSLMVQRERIRLQFMRPREHKFNPWVRKIPWRRKWQFTPVFLPGESRGQRWATVHEVAKSGTTTEWLNNHHQT